METYFILTGILLAICSFILFNFYYRKYYKHMKHAHNDEWLRLMNRDSIVATTGEWIRWPVGSVYLLKSIFKTSETYNDKKVEQYKKKAVFFFAAFIMSFVLFWGMAIILSKL